MTHRERFRKVMGFEKTDRIPAIELCEWWDKTIERWKTEGLPQGLADAAEIREKYFGLDPYKQCWLRHVKPGFSGCVWGKCPDMEMYRKIRPFLFPEQPFVGETIRGWAEEQKKGNAVVWITLEGFFWFPRTLFGIEKHLYAFYDSADVMREMNKDLLEFQLRAYGQFCEICVPDFMTFAEDMSYNNGPMISKDLFDEFMAPYYGRIVPVLKKMGTIPFIDSDGKIDKLIPWFAEVGIDGFLPLERQAGVDIAKYREQYPRLRLFGAYDKMVMVKTEAEMRQEFERILPVMKQGGYIPSVDHQTPPGVSLSNYKIYLKLLKEYCSK